MAFFETISHVWSDWIVGASWQLTLFVFLTATGAALIKRAPNRIHYCLWLLVTLKAITPPSLAAPWGVGHWGVRPAVEQIRPFENSVLLFFPDPDDDSTFSTFAPGNATRSGSPAAPPVFKVSRAQNRSRNNTQSSASSIQHIDRPEAQRDAAAAVYSPPPPALRRQFSPPPRARRRGRRPLLPEPGTLLSRLRSNHRRCFPGPRRRLSFGPLDLLDSGPLRRFAWDGCALYCATPRRATIQRSCSTSRGWRKRSG